MAGLAGFEPAALAAALNLNRAKIHRKPFRDGQRLLRKSAGRSVLICEKHGHS